MSIKNARSHNSNFGLFWFTSPSKHTEMIGFHRHGKCTILRESQTDLDVFREKRVQRVHFQCPLRMAIPKNQFWSFFPHMLQGNIAINDQKWIGVAVWFVFVRSLYVDVPF